jgi:hypothetical protein
MPDYSDQGAIMIIEALSVSAAGCLTGGGNLSRQSGGA